MAVPYTFGNATTSIPLSQLDTNFATAITIGNTAVYLGNTTTTFGNVTLNNVTINSGNSTVSSESISGNLTFTGTGNRILGDFSNATIANRVLFQTSTTNGNTNVSFIPNGTATQARLNILNSSDTTNYSVGSLLVSSAEVRLVSDAAGTGTQLPMTIYTNGSERMRIDTSGNVGIGTSSPATLLHVSGSSTTAIGRIANTGVGATSFDGSGAGLELLAGGMNTTSKYTPAIKFGSTDAEFTTTNPKFGASIIASAAQGYTSDTTGGMNLEFWTAPANPGTGSGLVERMRIDSSGNVGIGTTSPASILDVYQSSIGTYLRAGTSSAARQLLFTSSTTTNAGDTHTINASSGSGIIAFATNSTERMRIDSSGSLLVGTTTSSGSSKLRVNNAGVDGLTDTTISTTFVNLWDLKNSASVGLFTIIGDNGSVGFSDLVLAGFGSNVVVISSNNMYGSPAARTYQMTGNVLQGKLASGSLTWRTAQLIVNS